MAKKGALAVDPKVGKQAPVRLSPGVYRDPNTGTVYHSSTGGPFKKDPDVKKKPLTPGSPTPNQPAVPLDQSPAGGTYTPASPSPNTDIENTTSQYMQQFQNMGQFQPTLDPLPQMPQQDYGAMRQKAEQMAMESFDRNMGPQFQREESAFRQRMAEQGVPETSESYKQQYMDMKNTQNSARQNAMTQAFQSGQGEQAQAYGQQAQNYQLGMAGRDQQFNQGLAQYRLPMEQLGALSPYYGGMQQNNQFGQQMSFNEKQAELQRQHDEQMAAQQNRYQIGQMKLNSKLNPQRGGGGGGGGGGGMSLQDKMALLNQEFYNNMVAGSMQNGNQMPLPGYGGGFLQGAGQGIGAGTTLGLGLVK